MDRKKIFIIAGFVLGLLFLVIGIVLYTNSQNKNINKANYVGAYEKVKSGGGKVTIKTPDGDVLINNIFEGKTSTDSDGQDVLVLSNETNYKSHYAFDGDYFQIDLYSSELSNRQKAESSFIKSLDIEENDACKLRVFEYRITDNKGEDLRAFDYGLSFCPNAFKLQ